MPDNSTIQQLTRHVIVRKGIAVALGLLAGFVGVMFVEVVSARVYPMPEGLEITDREGMVEFVRNLPAGAMWFLIAAHFVGALLAGFSCEFFLRERWVFGAMLLAMLFTIAGIANLLMIPHPQWFAIVDTLTYVPGACIGYLLAIQIPQGQLGEQEELVEGKREEAPEVLEPSGD